MPTLQKSTLAKKETTQPDWYVVDGKGEVVGRFATRLATILMGKHKPTYTPHVDCGDCVIVVNAELVRFTGAGVAHPKHPNYTVKLQEKEYQTYSGYPGGRRIQTGADVWERHPERILYEAVRRMMPKSKMGRKMLKKLKLYVGAQHPHQSQQPKDLPAYL